MIERIEIAGCASYGDQVQMMDGLATFNFVYGANGAGKTTVSRLIANHSPYSACAVHWRSGAKLDTLVYNRDFVHANFNQTSDLKGIFTLGEKNIEILEKIASTKDQIAVLNTKMGNLANTLGGTDGKGGKTGELAAVEQSFKDECWELKKKHDMKLQGAMAGYRNDAQKFKDKLLTECLSTASISLTQLELEKKAESVFGPAPVIEPAQLLVNDAALLTLQVDPILKKRVLGKDDVDIAGMIKKLGNSDWVKQGVVFFELNEEYCPFCQQPAPEQLSASLGEYFNETFLQDTAAIVALQSDYKLQGERVQQVLQSAVGSKSKFLEVEKLATEKAIFDSRFQLNLQRIENKRKEPSQIIDLEPLDQVMSAAKQLIAEANQKIQAHNTMVANLTSEKQTLTKQVWIFLATVEIKSKFVSYQTAKGNIEKAISSIAAAVTNTKAEKTSKEAELRTLEKSTTSIQPTVNEINKILKSFGFTNFSLATSSSGTSYVICRADGSNAKDTLSEGERSFITFLYFYHLLRGSESAFGVTNDRVVVFDDPVSSLDSDILFIVGSLIKQVLEDVRMKKSPVMQVFVLTHNVYFHKEVTFNPKRTSGALTEETFWTIRKVNDVSSVIKHADNPVRTSYDLLWSEVRTPTLSSQTIQNTLRRILENYFRILGGMDTDAICNQFEGYEKLICRSLFSWVNDGSHSVHDDLYISADEKAVESFLMVFRQVFTKLGHPNHYKMMMGKAYVEEQPVADLVEEILIQD
jgi:wobble nucleotide-excising tRNase